jgi:hypothetical protein
MAGEVRIMEAFQTLAKSTVEGAVILDQLLDDVLKSLRSARRVFRQRITGEEKLRCEVFAEFLLRLREHVGAFPTRNIQPGDRPRSERLREEIATVSRAKLNCDPTSHLSRLLEEVLRLRTERSLSPPIE